MPLVYSHFTIEFQRKNRSVKINKTLMILPSIANSTIDIYKGSLVTFNSMNKEMQQGNFTFPNLFHFLLS